MRRLFSMFFTFFISSFIYSQNIIIDLDSILLKPIFSKKICELVKKHAAKVSPGDSLEEFDGKFDFVSALLENHKTDIKILCKNYVSWKHLYSNFNKKIQSSDFESIIGTDNILDYEIFANNLKKDALIIANGVLFGPNFEQEYFNDCLKFADCYQIKQAGKELLIKLKFYKNHEIYFFTDLPSMWVKQLFGKINSVLGGINYINVKNVFSPDGFGYFKSEDMFFKTFISKFKNFHKLSDCSFFTSDENLYNMMSRFVGLKLCLFDCTKLKNIDSILVS